MAVPGRDLGVCRYLAFLFVSYCAAPDVRVLRESPNKRFDVVFEWTHVNFTWPNADVYREALFNKRYIPENNLVSGGKVYKDRVYFSLPRVRDGTPVALAYVPLKSPKRNPLLVPFPLWQVNVQPSCATLQNVLGFEIDRRGLMWVLDGVRFNGYTSCPPKIVLLDLNDGGKVVQSYTFPNEVCLRRGGFLNDLVVDESDGGYAYITDSSASDPGLIVYSRQQGRSWKLRDRTMFAELAAANFTVDGVDLPGLVDVNGIAMSPLPPERDQERLVYYAALAGFRLYALTTQILRDEALARNNNWRESVRYVGKKKDTSDGMLVDNKGDMYFGLLTTYGVARWNVYEPFSTATKVEVDRKKIKWADSFSMDGSGFLYTVCNNIHKYFNGEHQLQLDGNVKMRWLKMYTGAKSYLYPAGN